MLRTLLTTVALGLCSVALPLEAKALAPKVKATSDEATHVQRFALIVGANSGGSDRATLRYATSDARAFERVLSQVGGLEQRERVILLDPQASELDRAFAEMRKKVQESTELGSRSEFIFYYSGHSDEQGLLLDKTVISYAQLRQWIDSVATDVHIAVLDSCASGAFTRIKGGVRREPFMHGSAGSVKGHAFLTSSSADESAQESDRVGGSFFTHYLVSGLRGAADVDVNGVVTLNEAFLFARDETLARTTNTQGGPQHAAYDFRLAGTGDIVLTDVRKADAALVLGAKVSGRVFVRNEKGQLVAELFKTPGTGAVRLALEPGPYEILVEESGKTWTATMTVVSGESVEVRESSLVRVQREAIVATRGSDAPAATIPPPAQASTAAETSPAAKKWTTVPTHLGLVPGMQVPAPSSDHYYEAGLSLSLLWGQIDRVRGFSGALGATRVRENLWGTQVALGAAMVGGHVHGAQIALGMAQAKSVHGAQAALGLSIVEDKVDGISAALGASINGGNTRGVQAALGLAIAGGRLDGLQGALGATFANEASRGGQLALGANIAPHGLTGIQAALGMNLNQDVQGAQLALGVNASKRLRGAQIGSVNVSGGGPGSVQVGWINIAEDADAQIGLLSISKKHGIRPILWASELSPLHVGVRFAANYTYSELFFALIPHFGRTDTHRVTGWRASAGAVLGARLVRRPHFELDLDLMSQSLLSDEPDEQRMWNSLRLLAEYRVARHFGIFGGPTFTTGIDFGEESRRRVSGYLWRPRIVRNARDAGVSTSPGLTFGLRF
jgi:hypothetical protein